MAWDTELVERLRYVINDLDSTAYTWTNTQLQKYLAVSASDVFNDLQQYSTVIGSGYSVSLSASGVNMITPDPLDSGAPALSNLIVFKAACLIARGDLKKAGITAGWKVVDDRSTIDGSKAIEGYKEAVTNYCGAYTDTLNEFRRGNQYAGSAILSPYASANGSIAYTFHYSYNRFGGGGPY